MPRNPSNSGTWVLVSGFLEASTGGIIRVFSRAWIYTANAAAESSNALRNVCSRGRISQRRTWGQPDKGKYSQAEETQSPWVTLAQENTLLC